MMNVLNSITDEKVLKIVFIIIKKHYHEKFFTHFVYGFFFCSL